MKDTKEHIMKTAFGLFLRKSYKEVTMKEIVKSTSLSKGAFYHYFSSKEQLFLEIIDVYLDLGKVGYEKFSHDSLHEFYNEFLRRWNDFFEHFKEGEFSKEILTMNFFNLMFDAMKRLPNFTDKLRKMHKLELESWIKIIKIAREKGEIESPLDDIQIAKMFIYYPDGLYMHCILDGRTDEVFDEMKVLFDNFYQQIKRK
jgi:TetR/AcrR family transcriptional regulator, transcriptional repressor for nem operon